MFRRRRNILEAPRDGYRRGRDVFILFGDGRWTVPVFRRQVTLMACARGESCSEGEMGVAWDPSEGVHSFESERNRGHEKGEVVRE